VVSNELDMASIWKGWLVLLPKKKVKLGRMVTEKQLPKPVQQRRAEQKMLLLLLQNKFPDLFQGRTGTKLSVKKRNALVELIHDESPSESKFKYRMHFLILGIMLGNNLNIWDINPPAPPLLHKKLASLITLNSVSRRHILNKLKAWFMKSLEHMDALNEDQRRGQLLFSMIVFGGVFNAKKLALLCSAINDDQVRSTRHHFWVRVQDDTKKENDSLQMWFADPLSEALFYKWLDFSAKNNAQCSFIPLGEQSPTREIWRILKVFLNSILAYEYKLPSSLGNFIDLARSGVILDLTPVLVGYASGNGVCESLPPQAWLRLRQDCKLSNEAEDEKIVIKYRKRKISLPTIGVTAKAEVDQDVFKHTLSEYIRPSEKSSLYGMSRRKRVKDLRKWLGANVSKMRPITAIISSWALFLLSQKGKGKQAAGGVTTYISRISRLYDVSENFYLPELEEDDLMAIYEQFVMRLKGLKSRGQNCACLSYFHEFMIRQYAATEVDFSLIDGFISPVGSVDANILTMNDFEQLKATLMNQLKFEKDSDQQRIKLIRLLIVILGYRCGLRASEARKIRIMDVCLSLTKPELFIRNSAFSRLKTANGVRQVPLKGFLQDDEMNILKQWHKKRCAEVLKKHDRPLFTRNGGDKYAIGSQFIFPHINDLMRILTGDLSVHFHHLRHSFASWTLLRLIAPDYSQMLESDIAKNNGITECRDLSLTLTGEEHPGSKAMYALARLMGHASPAETMRSYIHLLDWMLEKGLQRVSPVLTPLVAKNVFGVSDSMISRRLRKNPAKTNIVADMFIQNRRKQFKDQFKDETESMSVARRSVRYKEIEIIVSEMTKHRHSAINMWGFMRAYNGNGRAWGKISYGYSVDEEYLKAWWDAASLVDSFRTRSTKKCKETWKRYSGSRCGQIKTARPIKNGFATRLHSIPHLKDEGNVSEFESLMDQVDAIPKKYNGLLAACVFDFIQRAPVTGSELRFWDNKKARVYLKFLKLLGIDMARIRVLYYPSTAIRRCDNSIQIQQSQMDYWILKLNLSPSQIIKKDKSAVRETGKHGWVGITVGHWQEKELTQFQSSRRVTDHAFKVVLHTMAVQMIISSPDLVDDYLL